MPLGNALGEFGPDIAEVRVPLIVITVLGIVTSGSPPSACGAS